MQTLKVKIRDPKTGAETLKEVKIIRGWNDASGSQVFLHTNGVYGYKDGAPVKSEAELTSVIPDKIQRERALHWWATTGRKVSEAYYAGKEELARKLAGDFRVDDGKANAERDAAMYCRKESGSVNGPWSAAMPWMEIFPARPDWWGQCDTITFADYSYVRPDKADNAPPPDDTAEKAASEASAAMEKTMWEKICKICPAHADKCKCAAGSDECRKRYAKKTGEEF